MNFPFCCHKFISPYLSDRALYPICTTGNCGAVFILYGRCAAIQMVVLRLSGIIITNRGANYNHLLSSFQNFLRIFHISAAKR